MLGVLTSMRHPLQFNVFIDNIIYLSFSAGYFNGNQGYKYY